jgi:hypothetical protein
MRLGTALIELSNDAGDPEGYIYAQVVRDSTTSPGTPSTSASDVVFTSAGISAANVPVSATQYTIEMPVVLTPGTYHFVLVTDAAYKLKSVTSHTVALNVNTVASSAPFMNRFNGTTWSAVPGNTSNMDLILKGRLLDLRVRLIAPRAAAYPAAADGYGVFYNLQDTGLVGATRKNQRFVFDSVADNLSTFVITAFDVDPDLISCFYVEAGQVFKVPAFTVQGNTISFPANSFNGGGVSSTVTLIFDQNAGGTFDNSDANARLLAANFLGSTDPSIDRSYPGRGTFMRRPDGTLREVALDNSDNLVVYSV